MSKQNFSAYFFLLIAIVGWSGNIIFGRYLHDTLPAFGLAFWRWAIALLILMLWNFKHTLKFLQLLRQYFYQLFLLAVFGIILGGIFQYVALDYTSATDVGIMISLMPIFIALCAEVMLKEKTSRLQKIGMLIAFIGALILISEGSIHNIMRLKFNFGDFISLSASFAWGIYTALLKKYKIPCSSWELVQATGFISLIIITLVLFACGLPAVHQTFSLSLLTPSTLLGLAYVSIGASILSYWGWNRGVELVGPSRSGVFLYLVPIFSVIFAAIFLGERFHLYHLLGGIIIFSGVYVTTLKR